MSCHTVHVSLSLSLSNAKAPERCQEGMWQPVGGSGRQQFNSSIPRVGGLPRTVHNCCQDLRRHRCIHQEAHGKPDNGHNPIKGFGLQEHTPAELTEFGRIVRQNPQTWISGSFGSDSCFELIICLDISFPGLGCQAGAFIRWNTGATILFVRAHESPGLHQPLKLQV